MIGYKSKRGDTQYKGVLLTDTFSNNMLHPFRYNPPDQTGVAFHSNLGSITVLDRLTGYGGGVRDVESGYRSEEGLFWLASGGVDIRSMEGCTIGEVIQYIKDNANTCIGV